MNEEQFLASLKCLNTDSLEEFYLNSLTPEKRVGFQMNMLKILTSNYTPTMVLYAYCITLATNIISLFIPGIRNRVPVLLTEKLAAKTWYKNDQKNSFAIAVIKAVQARYKQDIFKNIRVEFSGAHKIILKDATVLTILPHELELTKQLADFSGPDGKEKDMAYLALAAITKNYLLQEDLKTFEQAYKFLEIGSSPERCAELLGYLKLIMKVDPMRGLNDIVVAYSKTCAVCITYGFIQGYGEKLIFAGHDTWGEKLTSAFLVC